MQSDVRLFYMFLFYSQFRSNYIMWDSELLIEVYSYRRAIEGPKNCFSAQFTRVHIGLISLFAGNSGKEDLKEMHSTCSSCICSNHHSKGRIPAGKNLLILTSLHSLLSCFANIVDLLLVLTL